MLWLILGGAALLCLLVAVLLVRRARARSAANQLTSLVMLRSEPARITEDQVRAAAQAVFRESAGVMSLFGDRLPPGLAGGFAITLDNTPVFYVINAHRPYVEDPRTDSTRHEQATREAFANHKAWVSVDVVGGAPDPSMRQMIFMGMATIAVHLMDAKTSLLYSTWLDRVALPGALRKAGESGDVEAVFAA
jgi:hypothetical protein